MSATAGDTAGGPSCDIDPFGEEFHTDPFPFLAQIPGAGPAVHLPRYGVWAVAGYRNVQAVLRDHERFSSAPGVGLANLATDPYGWRPPSLLLETDPPPHAVYRALVVNTMTPRALQAFQDLFEAEAARVVTTLVRRERFDAVTDLAEIFPTVVFPHALGIQGDTRKQLLAYGRCPSTPSARTTASPRSPAPQPRERWTGSPASAGAPRCGRAPSARHSTRRPRPQACPRTTPRSSSGHCCRPG